VGLIGAGAFARGTLLPLLRELDGVALRRVACESGLSADEARRRFGFESAGTEAGALLADEAVQLLVVATRHDSHAELTATALESGRHVLVEKPLALSSEELARVERAARGAAGTLTVGFNRRFAPLSIRLREAFAGRGPIAASARVCAGPLPAGHWLADPRVGGGRLLGEACHHLDLLSFLAGDPAITGVEVRWVGPARGEGGALVLVSFADGSVGEIQYLSDCSPALPKERIEVHAAGASALVDDFREGRLWEGRRRRALRGRGKGHREEIAAVVAAARSGGPAPVPLPVVLGVSRAVLSLGVGEVPPGEAG
jgi:predicted dehydrogenase